MAYCRFSLMTTYDNNRWTTLAETIQKPMVVAGSIAAERQIISL